MTQLHGVEIMTGMLLSGGTTNFTSPTGVTATGDRNGSVAWPPPGHLYITANLKDLGVTALGDLTAGIGLTVPFGSLTRWPNDGPFRTATTFNTLPLLDIKPTLAYKLTDDLSIGLGADIYTFSGLFGEGHVERKSVWPGGGGIPAGSQVELFGRDTAAGFNASLLYTPLRNADGKPLANIGIVYRSQATLHLSGAFLANGAKVSDANATFVLPPIERRPRRLGFEGMLRPPRQASGTTIQGDVVLADPPMPAPDGGLTTSWFDGVIVPGQALRRGRFALSYAGSRGRCSACSGRRVGCSVGSGPRSARR